MQDIPVFVVSLKSAVRRRALIDAQLKRLGIEYEFFDAVRGSEIEPSIRRDMNPGGNMSPGELGCYLSHIRIYERMVAQNISVALILEDDVALHESTSDLVKKPLSSLNFDYCFLGSEDRGDEGYVFFDVTRKLMLSEQHEACYLSSGPYCTHAYLVSLAGANKRLSCAFPARTAIDHYHYLPYRPVFYSIVPVLAFVNEESAVGSISSVSWSGIQARMRRHWWYYPLRDILKFKFISKMLHLNRADFGNSGVWRPLESGLRVAPEARLLRAGGSGSRLGVSRPL